MLLDLDDVVGRLESGTPTHILVAQHGADNVGAWIMDACEKKQFALAAQLAQSSVNVGIAPYIDNARVLAAICLHDPPVEETNVLFTSLNLSFSRTETLDIVGCMLQIVTWGSKHE